jgi:hypothetical protein
MKKWPLLALACAFITVGALTLFFAPPFLMHLLMHLKVAVAHNSNDIQNALLELKQQKSEMFAEPQLIFKISRRAHVNWIWWATLNEAGVTGSWTQSGRRDQSWRSTFILQDSQADDSSCGYSSRCV